MENTGSGKVSAFPLFVQGIMAAKELGWYRSPQHETYNSNFLTTSFFLC